MYVYCSKLSKFNDIRTQHAFVRFALVRLRAFASRDGCALSENRKHFTLVKLSHDKNATLSYLIVL